MTLRKMAGTVNVYSTVKDRLIVNTEEIGKVTSLDINPPPSESVTLTGITKVEMTGIDNGEIKSAKVDEVEADDS